MRGIATATTSLRSARLRARAPRALAYTLVAILCLAGLRVVLTGSPDPVAAPTTPLTETADRPAEAFAEGFARAYLTWDSARPDERESALTPYVPNSMSRDAGLVPPPASKQDVLWTAVTTTHQNTHGVNVTVEARTSNGSVFLTVPVGRDGRGFLYVAGYPALVGAPPVQREVTQPMTDEVEDEGLRTVVTRALTNYLTGTRQNLYADLTPGAVVSLPARVMRSAEVGDITWVIPLRRVAVEVTARDELNASWSLRYELEVRHRDRWYVHAVQNNPTDRGDP